MLHEACNDLMLNLSWSLANAHHLGAALIIIMSNNMQMVTVNISMLLHDLIINPTQGTLPCLQQPL